MAEQAVAAVTKWASKMIAGAMAGPPKVYNPQYHTWKAWMSRWAEVSREAGGGFHGFGVAYNKARMESVFRKGTLVGTDGNGNKYYENREATYGRTRWVEYPTPPGVWGIELRYDASMVSPEWHGWLHYMHDKTGAQLQAEFEKPFKQEQKIAAAMQKKEFSRQWFGPLDPPMPEGFHQPPGQAFNRSPRGRIGPKYEAWSGSPVQGADPKLRNYADNSKTLHIP